MPATTSRTGRCAVSDEDPHVENPSDIDASWVTRFSTDRGGKPSEIVDQSPQQAHLVPESDTPSTENRGQPVDYVDNPTPGEPADDLASTALAGARSMSRKGGPRRGRARRIREENLSGRRGGYSGPGPDPARDPQLLGTVLAGYVEDQGWDRPLAQARVFADWSHLVGADVAAHCAPHALNAGELRIVAESTAWATQLRLLASTLLARLVAELGPDVVTKLVITGPTGPSWKHGGRSVRGARGPRDTYG